MDDTIIGLILVSIIGAAAGIYSAIILKPLNNYLFFVAIFALIGIGIAALFFWVLFEVHRWLNQ